MSTRQNAAPGRLVTSTDDLVAWIAAGEKPKADWRIGTEHEKFVFKTGTLAPVPYAGERGIGALMSELMRRHRWQPIIEGGHVIALKRPDGEKGGTISLEPGGQFELSGEPLETLHETAAETEQHLLEVLGAGEELSIGFLGIGFTPKWRLDQVPLMPKERYKVMMRYMPQVGSRGLDMMFRTATVQVNVDFSSEDDMVKKLRVSLALQPIATALFAASPLTEGKPNGFQSMRSEVWRDTDKRRTGMLPFVFEDGMSYQRYVDYALDVPMYFVYRHGQYIDVTGQSFRTFMAGKLHGFEGQFPTIDDWSDHLTTLFPEVRMKRFLEMRGADGGRWHSITALPAFWTGILYDAAALDAAAAMVADWTENERQDMRDQVPRLGLATPFRNATLLDLARDAMAISRQGLAARRLLDSHGRDETVYLEHLDTIVGENRTVADELLDRFHGEWGGNVDHIFAEFAF